MIDIERLYVTAYDDVQKPQHIPGGHWELECTGVFYRKSYQNEKGKDVSAQLVYFYRPVKPLGDVDKKALAALDGYDYSDEDTNGVSWNDWYDSGRDRARHADHIKAHTYPGEGPSGPVIERGEDGEPKVRKEFRAGMIGGRIVGKLKPGVTRDGSPRMEVDAFFPVQKG